MREAILYYTGSLPLLRSELIVVLENVLALSNVAVVKAVCIYTCSNVHGTCSASAMPLGRDREDGPQMPHVCGWKCNFVDVATLQHNPMWIA